MEFQEQRRSPRLGESRRVEVSGEAGSQGIQGLRVCPRRTGRVRAQCSCAPPLPEALQAISVRRGVEEVG